MQLELRKIIYHYPVSQYQELIKMHFVSWESVEASFTDRGYRNPYVNQGVVD